MNTIYYAVGIVEVEIWIPANPGSRYEAEDGLIGFSSRGGSIGIWRRYHGGSLLGATFFKTPATASTIGITIEIKDLVQDSLIATTKRLTCRGRCVALTQFASMALQLR